MGASLVETYLDRCRTVAAQGKGWRIAAVWVRALADSVLNGIAERLRPGVRWRRAGNWGRDTELAVRRLKRAPAFSLAMLGTLIVGLGGFAVVLTVIDKTLIEPLPYERPHDLYFVWRDLSTITDVKRGWVGGPDVADLGKAGGPIAGSVGLRLDRRTFADTRAGDGNPEELSVMISSPNLFDLLGTRPILGRAFAPNEVGDDRPPVVVLGYDVWQRRFGGDRGVVGAQVKLNGTVFTVIGVMGRDFHFVRHASLGSPESADVYITFPYAVAQMNPGHGAFAALIRARPGASASQVRGRIPEPLSVETAVG